MDYNANYSVVLTLAWGEVRWEISSSWPWPQIASSSSLKCWSPYNINTLVSAYNCRETIKYHNLFGEQCRAFSWNGQLVYFIDRWLTLLNLPQCLHRAISSPAVLLFRVSLAIALFVYYDISRISLTKAHTWLRALWYSELSGLPCRVWAFSALCSRPVTAVLSLVIQGRPDPSSSIQHHLRCKLHWSVKIVRRSLVLLCREEELQKASCKLNLTEATSESFSFSKPS